MSETAASRDEGVSPDGVLEEIDGSPIGASSGAATRGEPGGGALDGPATMPWWTSLAVATSLTARRPRLWAFALVPFLARGGLIALALPMLVLPTFVGMANFVGPASVSAEGPGPRLVILVALGVATLIALVVVGTLVAAAAEVTLHRATVAAVRPGEAGFMTLAPASPAVVAGAGTGGAVARVAVIRLVLLVPVAGVAAVAVPAWVAAAYHELTLPSDVAVPLLIRVLAGAPAASVAVVVAWLAGEIVGGFATRRAALLGVSIPRALAGGLVDPLRAPVGTLVTVAAALAGSALTLAPAWWAISAAWEAARVVLGGTPDPLAAVGVALLLAAAWLAGLALAAVAAAWRGTLATMELLRRAP